jgi:ligand-binding sensor domain-containing protein/DNA-binding CsgD family transcriptional regulator
MSIRFSKYKVHIDNRVSGLHNFSRYVTLMFNCRVLPWMGLLISLLYAGAIAAQGLNLGIPPIRNFPKKVYQAGTQNWDATQDQRGVMYFANNEGLLQYDGSRWHCYPVANRTVLRSVAIGPSGYIYTGAQSELGYFAPDIAGCLQYHSLVSLLPETERNFEDVWDIVCAGDVVLFRTNHVVFVYSGGGLTTLKPGGELNALFATPAGVLLQQNQTELLLWNGQGFQPWRQVPEVNSPLTGVLPWQPDMLLFSSLKDGLFLLTDAGMERWHTPHDAIFQSERIYSATVLLNGNLALGTSLGGLLELDRSKRIYRHLNKKNGLQNNNILHTFSDRAGNLWLGLDSGIDCVALPSSFTTVIPDDDLQGTGYAASVFAGNLYLGVSSGVYQAPWRNYYAPDQRPYFKKMNATDGQVWQLTGAGEELLLGHHEGTFRIQNREVQLLGKLPGAWAFELVSDNYLLGGHYSGLVQYRKSGNHWVFDQKVRGLEESCRFVVKDEDGAVWVAHPYRGVYRVVWEKGFNVEPLVQYFNHQHGLPSDLNNFVFSIAGKAVFATEKGLYRFNRSMQRFEADADFAQYLGKDFALRYLREDERGNIWYVGGKEVGLLEVNDWGVRKTIHKRIFPELSGKLVAGFEFIYPLNGSNVFFGAEQGFIHFDPSAKGSPDTVLQVLISEVKAGDGNNETLLFGGWTGLDGQAAVPVLDAGMNKLSFAFSVTRYEDPDLLEFRYRMVGVSAGWSEWSGGSLQNYTNLGPGKYRFEVQARQKNGRMSDVSSFEFRIRPPWYASTVALGLYALGVLGFFVGFVIHQQRKFESEKVSLAEQHQRITAKQQREVERSKAAVSDILQEKLEAEIEFKNQELATATMHLVQKGEILQTIQENLDQILEKSTNPAVKKEIQQLLNLLNFDAKLNDDWEQFAFHFDRVHVDFLKQLREKHPELSSTDHKLCAYLRMNLSTKEIAPLMNISVRGVEASRYRLRKKLGLPNDANLAEIIGSM